MIKNEYKREINKYIDSSSEIFFYWKGRVGLYALLNAMEIGEGDEVIIPGFTCVVVANAIIYCGATPIYLDIDQESYSISVEKYQAAITPKTKVIICQNTFGLSFDVDKISSLGKAHGIWTIEDCTHGFGGTYKGQLNGAFCDASFFSTQWNKPFSTGIGGFVSTKHSMLIDKLATLNLALLKPSFNETLMLGFQIWCRSHLPKRFYWRARRLYRWLSKYNFVVGSSNIQELDSPKEMPKGYFKAMSTLQMKEGVAALKYFDQQLLQRKKHAIAYTDWLSLNDKMVVPKRFFDDHLFLCYPLLVTDKVKFFEFAELQEIPIGDWFFSPIYSVPFSKKHLVKWKVDLDALPNATVICSAIVNLPTIDVDSKKVIQFLNDVVELIK